MGCVGSLGWLFQNLMFYLFQTCEKDVSEQQYCWYISSHSEAMGYSRKDQKNSCQVILFNSCEVLFASCPY